jgi:hypothetical protein
MVRLSSMTVKRSGMPVFLAAITAGEWADPSVRVVVVWTNTQINRQES